jgi:hypothetical protein
MANLLSQVQQLLPKRDTMDVTKKMDKGTCIAKLRAWKGQLKTVASMFKEEACMFQDAFHLCDRTIRDCESHTGIDQHVFVNMSSICNAIVLKCEAVLSEHKAKGHQYHEKIACEYEVRALQDEEEALEYEAEAAWARECEALVRRYEYTAAARLWGALACTYEAKAAQKRQLETDAHYHEAWAREHEDWARQGEAKMHELQRIATQFTERASEFETIARQSKAGVYRFAPSIDAISEKGGIN